MRPSFDPWKSKSAPSSFPPITLVCGTTLHFWTLVNGVMRRFCARVKRCWHSPPLAFSPHINPSPPPFFLPRRRRRHNSLSERWRLTHKSDTGNLAARYERAWEGEAFMACQPVQREPLLSDWWSFVLALPSISKGTHPIRLDRVEALFYLKDLKTQTLAPPPAGSWRDTRIKIWARSDLRCFIWAFGRWESDR